MEERSLYLPQTNQAGSSGLPLNWALGAQVSPYAFGGEPFAFDENLQFFRVGATILVYAFQLSEMLLVPFVYNFVVDKI